MTAFARLVTGLALAVVTLAACGGGGGSSALPAKSTQSNNGEASVSVFVPSASASSVTRSGARRRALPAGTQSVEIVVGSQNATPVNVAPVIVNVSATAPGCSSSGSGISCTIDISVPYGALVFAVIGYSAQNATGSPIAWGYTVATISATGSNAVSITTSSVIAYFTMSLDGNISLAVIDHSANTIAVADTSSNTSIDGTITYLPNGDVKIVVTSSTDPGTAVGNVVYARELPGAALVFFSTGTSTPPAAGSVASGADWGVGTELNACPTAAASYDVSLASVEGPQFQVSPNFNTTPAFENGMATISLSGSVASLAFSGEAYALGGSLLSSETGTTGTCSSGIFAANTGTNGSGEVAYDAQGVIIGADKNPNGSTSVHNGFMGFTVQSGATIDLTALTSGTYDGFLGYYNVTPTIVKGGSAINASPAGSNTLNWCVYTNFEAGTVGTGSSNCTTAAFSSQPQPGIVLGSVGGLPAVFAVSQISGKYVIFGVESVSGVNFALMQH
jgi:hypothetical protein